MIQTFDFLTELSIEKARKSDAAVVRESEVLPGPQYTEEHLLEIEHAAYERGFLQGKETACSEFQVTIAQADQQREEKMRRRLESWSDVAQTRIDQQIDERIQATEDKLAATIVDALRPFLKTQCELKAVAELKTLLKVHLGWSEHKSAVVRAPEHLMSYLKEELGSELKDSEFVPSPDLEVSIEFADTVLRTQLTLWLRNLFSE